jgi:hypothetical protein
MRFRKRPVEIEARQWLGGPELATPIIDWVLAEGGTARWHDDPPRLHSDHCRCDGRGIIPGPFGQSALPCPETMLTGGGPEYLAIDPAFRARPGDWIIKDMNDTFSVCRPDIFDATYEPLE